MRHYILTKDAIWENITIINIYVPNNRPSKYMKQNWQMGGKIDNSTITVGNFKFASLSNGQNNENEDK